MALLSRRNREVFIDQYNFIYTYVASNKDGDKKYWMCGKGVNVTYALMQ